MRPWQQHQQPRPSPSSWPLSSHSSNSGSSGNSGNSGNSGSSGSAKSVHFDQNLNYMLFKRTAAEKATDVTHLHGIYDSVLNTTIQDAFAPWLDDDGFKWKLKLGAQSLDNSSSDSGSRSHSYQAFLALQWNEQRLVFHRMEKLLKLSKTLEQSGYVPPNINVWDKQQNRWVVRKGLSPFWHDEFLPQVLNKANAHRTVQEVLVGLLQALRREMQSVCGRDGACNCIDMPVVVLLQMAMPLSLKFSCKTTCAQSALPMYVNKGVPMPTSMTSEVSKACIQIGERLRFTKDTWILFRMFDRHVQFAFGCTLLQTETGRPHYVPCTAFK